MAFNFNNRRMGFGFNNNVNNEQQMVKTNFGARSVDDIREEMNNLKYHHGLTNDNTKLVSPQHDSVNHQERVNALRQINGYNNKL